MSGGFKIKVYYHNWNYRDDDGSSIVFYCKEIGYLEYFSDGFFHHYNRKKDIFVYNKSDYEFIFLGYL